MPALEMIQHTPLTTLDVNDITQISRYPRHGLQNLDAGENIFFNRELEHIIPELFEFEYARINARRLIPIDRSAGPGAEIITFRQITKTAMAKVISDYASDIPLANVFGEEFVGRVCSLACAAEWSIQEIRAAAMANRPLDRLKTEAAREAMLRAENVIAWEGDAKCGLVGIFSDPNIPRQTVPTGVGGIPWTDKTGPEMVDDMNLIANEIPENTGEVEAPNTMLLPTAQYNLAASTRMDTGTDTTVLSFFLANNPYITEVVSVNELKGIGTAGVDVMLAYDRNMSKLRLNVPLDIEQFPPQENNLTTKVIYHMRVGGVSIHKPISLNIGEGI